MGRVLWPLLSLMAMPVNAAGNGKDGGGGDGGDFTLEEQRAGMYAVVYAARRDVLRPLGLCPPWNDDEEEETEAEARGGVEHDEEGTGGWYRRIVWRDYSERMRVPYFQFSRRLVKTAVSFEMAEACFHVGFLYDAGQPIRIEYICSNHDHTIPHHPISRPGSLSH